jgi:hypothetical protein
MRACVLLLALALAGCHAAPAPAVPGVDGCDEAERRLAAMGCSEAVSPKGAHYTVVCKNARDNGIDIAACALTATSCEECR